MHKNVTGAKKSKLTIVVLHNIGESLQRAEAIVHVIAADSGGRGGSLKVCQ